MRKMKAPTEQNLYEAAIRYLQRYSSSSENLKRVLERRIKRYEMREKVPADPNADAWIDTAVRKCQQLGYVNDDAFAEQKVLSLRRQGRSQNYILRALQLKGLEKAVIQRFLGNDPEAELEAAQRYVQRRRLGGKTDPEARQKDLARLVRAGFSLDTARQALK